SHGVAPVADSWYSPTDALRQDLESSIPQFPYDPARAQALLAEAGWTRGADGTLVYGATGQPFEIELRSNAAEGIEREQSVVGDNWQTIGARVTYNIVPVARQGDNEYQSVFPGAYLFFSGAPSYWSFRMHSRQISSPENRWSGRNRGGYSNPRVDAVLDQLVATVDARARLPLHRQLLQEQMGDVSVMPLYWFVNPLLAVKAVKVPPVAGGEVTANFFDWDKV
ncbi:MAG: peptide/nickel transport system substrate-binding protein, partial [Chloroflexota bacterium]|nr:peptide/nickel transport system substrate-binding protein [Chloroflexota bacterium]